MSTTKNKVTQKAIDKALKKFDAALPPAASITQVIDLDKSESDFKKTVIELKKLEVSTLMLIAKQLERLNQRYENYDKMVIEFGTMAMQVVDPQQRKFLNNIINIAKNSTKKATKK